MGAGARVRVAGVEEGTKGYETRVACLCFDGAIDRSISVKLSDGRNKHNRRLSRPHTTADRACVCVCVRARPLPYDCRAPPPYEHASDRSPPLVLRFPGARHELFRETPLVEMGIELAPDPLGPTHVGRTHFRAHQSMAAGRGREARRWAGGKVSSERPVKREVRRDAIARRELQHESSRRVPRERSDGGMRLGRGVGAESVASIRRAGDHPTERARLCQKLPSQRRASIAQDGSRQRLLVDLLGFQKKKAVEGDFQINRCQQAAAAAAAAAQKSRSRENDQSAKEIDQSQLVGRLSSPYE